MLVPGEDEVHTRALEALDRIAGVVDDISLTSRAWHRQQVVVADEDAQIGRRREILLDPVVAAASDHAVVEVGLGRVDGHDGHAADTDDRVAVAEQLLEVDVADVAGVVVPGDHDDGLALDLIEVVLGEGILLLEPERRQVSRHDDDVGLELVHLCDGALEEVREEELSPAVQVRDLHDGERPVRGRHVRSVGPSGPAATLI